MTIFTFINYFIDLGVWRNLQIEEYLTKLHSLSLRGGMNNAIKFISGVKREAPPIRLCEVVTKTIHLVKDGKWICYGRSPCRGRRILLEERVDI